MAYYTGELAAIGGSKAFSAFEQMYRDYKPGLTRYLLGMCGDPELAEELAQEAFVRAATPQQFFLEVHANWARSS